MNSLHRFLFLLLVFALQGRGQDCPLGMGGTDPALKVQAFELDSTKKQGMVHWLKDLEADNSPLQRQLDSLMEVHPQDTMEQLTALGQEFERIKERMVANSLRYDQLLLGIFRPGQYRQYEAMCDKIGRHPLGPISESMTKPEEN